MIDEAAIRRRSIFAAVLSGLGGLAVLSALAYSSIRLVSLRGEVDDLAAKRNSLQVEVTGLEQKRDQLSRLYAGSVKELDADVKPAPVTKPIAVESIDRKAILNQVKGRRREALQLAMDLHDQHVPFRWGGKAPSDGFDSSGFIAYILSKVGVIASPDQYWSGRLRQKFGAAVGLSELGPGDLLFEEGRVCWLLLNDKFRIGMVPEGIVIGDISSVRPRIAAYGRVPYDRPVQPTAKKPQ